MSQNSKNVTHVYLPSPGKLVVLRTDAVASTAHLECARGSEKVKEIQIKHFLALMVKPLEQPDRSKELHTCLVNLIPEPLRETGYLLDCAPMHPVKVRIRTGIVPVLDFVKCINHLKYRLIEDAEEWLEDQEEYEDDADTVTGSDEEEDESASAGDDEDEEPLLLDDEISKQPVVDFSYEWPEDGIYDPGDWIKEQNHIGSVLFELRMQQALTGRIDPMDEPVVHRQWFRGESPILDRCRVVQAVEGPKAVRVYSGHANLISIRELAPYAKIHRGSLTLGNGKPYVPCVLVRSVCY